MQFEVLWPPKTSKKPGNDDSCVIRIDDGKHSLLLTGDAEKGGGAAAPIAARSLGGDGVAGGASWQPNLFHAAVSARG
ncbi:hypothetical protein IC615_14005 [Serratia ureilytica]